MKKIVIFSVNDYNRIYNLINDIIYGCSNETEMRTEAIKIQKILESEDKDEKKNFCNS